eukprot:TRINITY_DN4845_c0_g2_i1.p1 TRINITY_DN4845_c0_g2~~TRINITY_DN4845_c0_g2_i1.p1  ORF type:complete len:279 (+),score=54.68 TRINITY_DN4845_c0_g2_i1:117-953(+)
MQIQQSSMYNIINIAVLMLLWSGQQVQALSWRLYSNREDCVTEWAPKAQWDLLIESLKKQGRPTDNVQTNLILSVGFFVANKQGARGFQGAVDITVKTPKGDIIHDQKGLEDKEIELTTFGDSGPWQICFKINREKGVKASLVLDLTYFTVNQRSLVGTAWEMNRQKSAGQEQVDHVDLMQQLVSKSTELADKDQVAMLSRGIFDLDALLMGVVREQRHIQHRTEAQLSIVASTKGRMLWWTLFQTLVIISASFVQVYMVRKLFEKRDNNKQHWSARV